MYNELDCYENKIHLMYGSNTYDWNCHTVSGLIPNGNDVNAEHIVPQSLFNKKEPMVSDLHHLGSCASKANNIRSNHPFTEVTKEQMTKCSQWCKGFACTKTQPTDDLETYSCLYNKNTFMPVARDRGIIARAVLYFYTVYDQYYTEEMKQTGSIPSVGNISLFLKWNREFPPTNYEHERNEKINMTQGNRNPYVDNYMIADKAWDEYL